MKLTKLLLSCFLFFFIYSCSDDNEGENNPVGTLNLEAEKQINGVINILNGDKELSTFKDALASIDAKALADKEFTILAYKNQNIPKTKSSENDSIQRQETMRHIIGGCHTFETLSKLKKIVALSKDTLYIDYSESDKTLSVNGILLGKSVIADKSIIFVVDSIIPQAKDTIAVKEKEYVFTVININPNWGESNFSEGLDFVKDALISIYKDDKVIKELRTDIHGVARFIYKEDEDLDYIVKTDTSSMLYQGYLVKGLFMSQEQIDMAPTQKDLKAVPGGLRFVDINCDGIIDADDKMDRDELKNLSDIIYLVGNSYTFPKEDTEDSVSWEMIESAYIKSNEIFLSIDDKYSSLSQRQTLSPTSKIVDSLWNSSYDLITKVNKRLTEEVGGKRNQLLKYRAEAYINLITAFGGVPLQLENSLNFNLSRNTLAEVSSYISQDLDLVLVSSPDSIKYKSEIYVKSLHILRAQKNYNEAYEKSRAAINSRTFQLSTDSGATVLPVLYIYLIAAESANELGMQVEATQYINQLLNADNKPSLAGSSKEEIASVIRNYYIGKDAGLQYINIQSWGLNNTWSEKYKLLPIPDTAINAYNGNISQNPGY